MPLLRAYFHAHDTSASQWRLFTRRKNAAIYALFPLMSIYFMTEGLLAICAIIGVEYSLITVRRISAAAAAIYFYNYCSFTILHCSKLLPVATSRQRTAAVPKMLLFWPMPMGFSLITGLGRRSPRCETYTF